MHSGEPQTLAVARRKVIFLSYLGILLFAVPVFLAAGKLLFWQGLLYVGTALFGATINHILTRNNALLTIDRAAHAQDGQNWDKKILVMMLLVNLIMFTVAGLDSGRFGWSANMPVWTVIPGVILMLIGQILFVLAKRENAFFTSTVRIQNAHKVCDTGLYRFVRHPGYLGMLLLLSAFPLILQSKWAFIPMMAGVILLVFRTYLEDRFLKTKLPGYADFSKHTRWRLVPGIF
jgi:protein-S-isoprenylcysteine O-methyltransferase Ste14